MQLKACKWKEAFQLYERGVKLHVLDRDTRFCLYAHRAQAAARLGMRTQALFDCTVAIYLNPERHNPYKLRSWVYQQIGDFPKALEVLDSDLC